MGKKAKGKGKTHWQNDAIENCRFILLCSLIILAIPFLGGCAMSLPNFKKTSSSPVQDQVSGEKAPSPVQSKIPSGIALSPSRDEVYGKKAPPVHEQQREETVRSFPEFVAVIARSGDTFSSLAEKYLMDSSWGSFLAEYNETESLSPGQPVIIPLKPGKRGGLTLQGYQTVPVLSYHNFSSTDSSKMTVSQEMFDQQMGLLKEKGYRVISLDQFFDFLEFKAPVPPNSVVITIDDGWRSTYEIAFPILKKYGYPATLFIYLDRITDTSKTLSWGLLQEMAAHGFDVQCHTKSHRNLTLPGKRESFKVYFRNLEKELALCKGMIKNKLDRDVNYLAYPYGDTNPLVIEVAKKLGYRGAFTIKRGSNPFFIHNYRVNRSMVYGDFSLSQFERNLATFHEESLR